MRKFYDITVKGYGIELTFRKIETEKHEEFYVNAIDKFNDYMKKKGMKKAESYFDHLANLECRYVESYK